MSTRLPPSPRPTPIEHAPRLARALGLGPDDLWIKRDDLLGLGGGGNKVRKLEWTVGDAVAAGAPQGNHARLTAAAAAKAGLSAVLVFPGRPGDPPPGTSFSTAFSAPVSRGPVTLTPTGWPPPPGRSPPRCRRPR